MRFRSSGRLSVLCGVQARFPCRGGGEGVFAFGVSGDDDVRWGEWWVVGGRFVSGLGGGEEVGGGLGAMGGKGGKGKGEGRGR